MVPIRLEAVSKHFGRTVAVDRVDLNVEPGELFFLLGPSGCGKTTLLRMIAGLTETTDGSIHFGAREVTHLPTSQRNTAMVFQGYALWPHMTVAQNVAFGLEVRKVPAAERRRRVATALETVHMGEHADRRPAQLSGGQQQRVALARALVVEPDVLLLDEPLSNLDAQLRLEMRGEIRRICTEARITSVYVTHDQEEALSMADRVAVMCEGRLCQIGPPRELYGRPASRFVASFLGQTNLIAARVVERAAGSVCLESDAGLLRSSVFPDPLPVGGVTCSIRPESVRLLEPDASADNVLLARHLETVYQGHVAQHLMELAEGLRIRVHELRPRPRTWSDGTARLGIDAADVVVLAD